MPNKTLSVREQDLALWERADRAAKDSRMSLSGLVAEALAKYLGEQARGNPEAGMHEKWRETVDALHTAPPAVPEIMHTEHAKGVHVVAVDYPGMHAPIAACGSADRARLVAHGLTLLAHTNLRGFRDVLATLDAGRVPGVEEGARA